MVDKNCNRYILGSLMQHPQFLSETDKYNLTIDDFSTSLEKYVFMAITGLYSNGAKSINVIDVENFLESSPVAKAVFVKQKGIEYLQDSIDFCSVDNFEYYYSKLKKLNLLNSLQKSGIDISDFYCEDLTRQDAFEINEKFELLTIPQILEAVKKKLFKLEHDFMRNDVTEVESIADGIDDFIENLVEEYNIGLPLQGEIYNEIAGGAQLGTLTIRSMPSGVGKALPNNTVVPTPLGWRQVGEIRRGDYLFDALGKPTKVLNVYPQGIKRVWKVTFQSGRVAYCCDEHLWSYYDLARDPLLKTKTLKEIRKEGGRANYKKNGKWKYRVPISACVQLPEKSYFVNPYSMGFVLGKELPDSNYVIKNEDNPYLNLQDCTNSTKFIPEEYLFGSADQRLELLQGLMDSGGSFSPSTGRTSFTTTSLHLKTNVMALLGSLGFLFRSCEKTNSTGQITYRIDLIIPNYVKKGVFTLPEKRQLVEKYLETHPKIQNCNFNTDPIIKIEKTSQVEEMTCFYVDNEQHLFAAGDTWWITHNTRQSVGDACLLAFPFRYDNSESKWVQVGNGEKVLFIATEQSFKEIRKMVVAYLTGINEDKFKYTTFTEEERIRIKQALELIKEYKDNLYIVRMPNPTIELAKSIIRENCLLYGIEYVFYDYIFIGPALLNEFRGFNLRNDEVLLMFATALKDLAVEQNIFILTSTQVNSNVDSNKEIRNESSLAGGRATINKADIGLICSRPTVEELETLGDLCKRYGEPNIVSDVYKVRGSRWTQVRIWSHMDLGIMRKKDLFVTDARLHAVPDFETREDVQVISFEDLDVFAERLERLNNELS